MTKQVEVARSLRKRLTPQEVKVWVKLRELRSLGFHFRRQVPIGPYIVDFACLKQALAVEIDGGQHYAEHGSARDMARDHFLQSKGYRVLRISNADVDRNLNGVIEAIVATARSPHPARKRAPPSPSGGGIAPSRGKPIPPREGRVGGPQGQPGGATRQ